MSMVANQDSTAFESAWEAAKPGLPGGGWLQEMRLVAFNRYKTLGLPGAKAENWRYADLKPLRRAPFGSETELREIDGNLLEANGVDGLDGPRFVFVNGRLSLAHSRMGGLPEGLTVRGLRQTLTFGGQSLAPIFADLAGGDAFDQLNTALMGDGCLIEARPGIRCEQPIEILHLAAGDDHKAVHVRNIIRLHDGASLTVIESFGGEDAPHFVHDLSQILLSDGADLKLYRRQRQGRRLSHLARSYVTLGAARFHLTSLNMGGASAREEVRVDFTCPKGEADLDVIQLAGGGQTLDCNLLVDHAEPACASRQRYRGVVAADGRASIEAKVLVRRDAQKTDARQHLKSLLLDRTAEANAKPELEIYADDVLCAHGATAGEIDADQQFYLESRGLDPEAARALLIEAFVADLLDAVSNESLRAECLGDVRGWLARSGAEEKP